MSSAKCLGEDPSSQPPTPAEQRKERKVVHGLQDDCNIYGQDNYNICLDLKSDSGNKEAWMDGFAAARNRWEEVIVQDDETPWRDMPQLQSSVFATKKPSLIDDVYISASETYIDGVFGVLGSTGPTYVKYITDHKGKKIIHQHVLADRMQFDKQEINFLIKKGTWKDVILHEMGHVLGIGSLWQRNGLHTGTSDKYTGEHAQQEWKRIGCSGDLPVETDSGAGTAGGHWDEACMEGELMTGYADKGGMKLSRITIGSLEDMGYTGVNYDKADPYGLNDVMKAGCEKYCPEAKGLPPKRALRGKSESESSKSSKSSKKSKSRKNKKENISHKTLELAHKVATEEIEKGQAEISELALLEAGVEYVADKLISVYVFDDQGHVEGLNYVRNDGGEVILQEDEDAISI